MNPFPFILGLLIYGDQSGWFSVDWYAAAGAFVCALALVIEEAIRS